jgi:hypothetical protein
VFTFKVAAFEVAEPAEFVKTAWYILPFCDALTDETVSVVAVGPLMLLQEDPPSVLTCHWTVGVGSPLAAALNVALAPAQTVSSTG